MLGAGKGGRGGRGTKRTLEEGEGSKEESPLQYVRSHDHVILDPAHSPSEPSEIFLSGECQNVPGVKRRASDR
ncbi:hypothetical protein Trydic_g19875 [Trypoxylus dichotomus]